MRASRSTRMVSTAPASASWGLAGVKLAPRCDTAPTRQSINFHLQALRAARHEHPTRWARSVLAHLRDASSISTPASARRSSIMVAEGEYGFSGAIWAGRAAEWPVRRSQTPTNFIADKESRQLGRRTLAWALAHSTLAFGIRSIVGIGGIRIQRRSVRRRCASAAAGSRLADSGVRVQARQRSKRDRLRGWATRCPQLAATAINFFLGAIGAQSLDPVETRLPAGRAMRLFHGLRSDSDAAARGRAGR